MNYPFFSFLVDNTAQQVEFIDRKVMLTIRQSPKTWQISDRKKLTSPRFCYPLPKNQTFFPRISTIINSAAENEKLDSSSSAGRIKRLVLTEEGRTKLNNYPDREFYSHPRFVTHVDNDFISNLTNLYGEVLRPDMEILDLMSSWISHLPQEVKYKKVVGHGLNPQELGRNPRLDYFFVKDLNKEQELEFENGCFDAVLCTVSVQYLQQPEKVFAEIFRVLRPGGVFIVSFSNRLFYEKAISAWRDGTAYSRVQLVVQYFQCVEGFTQPQVIRKTPNSKQEKSIFNGIIGMLGLISGSDPFYSVIAYKNFKTKRE